MGPDTDPHDGEPSRDTRWLERLLHRLIGELESLDRRAVVGGASRRLIQHGRSLDALLWQAHRQWKEYSRQADPGTLDSLCETLTGAHSQAEELKAAILISTAPLDHAAGDLPAEAGDVRRRPPGSPPEEIAQELQEVRRRILDLLDTLDRRSSSADSPHGAPDSGRQDIRSGRHSETEEALEAGSATLEGLLWRITADWQHLQRSPSPDRVAMLCTELEKAADQVRRLADSIGQASIGPDPPPAATVAAPTHAPFRDALTGALNREGFDALVMGELKRSRRYRRPFTLLLVELRQGDGLALATTLDRLSTSLRGSDFIGRYVDRLIAIGLPETSSEAAIAAARRVMRSLPPGPAGRSAPRLGLASLPEDGRTLAELVALARRQLTEAPVSVSESGGDYWGV